MKLHRISGNRKLRVCKKAEMLSDVSDSEVFVMFVRVDGEDHVTNISEWHKII